MRFAIVQHCVLHDLFHVRNARVDGGIVVQRELFLHRAKIHGVFDDVEIVDGFWVGCTDGLAKWCRVVGLLDYEDHAAER